MLRQVYTGLLIQSMRCSADSTESYASIVFRTCRLMLPPRGRISVFRGSPEGVACKSYWFVQNFVQFFGPSGPWRQVRSTVIEKNMSTVLAKRTQDWNLYGKGNPLQTCFVCQMAWDSLIVFTKAATWRRKYKTGLFNCSLFPQEGKEPQVLSLWRILLTEPFKQHFLVPGKIINTNHLLFEKEATQSRVDHDSVFTTWL